MPLVTRKQLYFLVRFSYTFSGINLAYFLWYLKILYPN
jgi:hypothetical protein